MPERPAQPRTPELPCEIASLQVLVRFVFRLVILGAFAAFASQGFAHALAAMLVMAAIYCAIVGVLRGETLFADNLTNWDEAAVYLLIGRVAAYLA
jgi:hypothetical protein